MGLNSSFTTLRLDASFEYEEHMDVLSDASESRRVEPALGSAPRLQPSAAEFGLRRRSLVSDSFQTKISTFKPNLPRFINQQSWVLTVIEDEEGVVQRYPQFLSDSQAFVSIQLH